MIKSSTISFLKGLKKNNNKEWFDRHKEQYLEAKNNFAEFIDELITEITRFDKRYSSLTSKECLFRIYRDVRFSKDKRPYKVNMGASINPGGKKATSPGYYLHIEPGGSFLAGGVWMPSSDDLKKIRQEIDYNGKVFRKVLSSKDFLKFFGSLDESYKLKTTPKGYHKTHPDIELLRFNSFIVWHKFSDTQVQKKAFVKDLAKGCKIMKPFLDFLSVAVS